MIKTKPVTKSFCVECGLRLGEDLTKHLCDQHKAEWKIKVSKIIDGIFV